jgi:hypothetical protein
LLIRRWRNSPWRNRRGSYRSSTRPPLAEVEHVERETESYVAWVIVLGFVAYALALYWADRCNRRGGDPVIRFSVLRGFIVKCYK